jgi:hypothetical protein
MPATLWRFGLGKSLGDHIIVKKHVEVQQDYNNQTQSGEFLKSSLESECRGTIIFLSKICRGLCLCSLWSVGDNTLHNRKTHVEVWQSDCAFVLLGLWETTHYTIVKRTSRCDRATTVKHKWRLFSSPKWRFFCLKFVVDCAFALLGLWGRDVDPLHGLPVVEFVGAGVPTHLSLTVDRAPVRIAWHVKVTARTDKGTTE